jgi:hypothetical protein
MEMKKSQQEIPFFIICNTLMNKGGGKKGGAILDKKKLVTTYSPVPAIGTVPSALVGLTSLFGMGRGVAPPLLSPVDLIS